MSPELPLITTQQLENDRQLNALNQTIIQNHLVVKSFYKNKGMKTLKELVIR